MASGELALEIAAATRLDPNLTQACPTTDAAAGSEPWSVSGDGRVVDDGSNRSEAYPMYETCAGGLGTKRGDGGPHAELTRDVKPEAQVSSLTFA